LGLYRLIVPGEYKLVLSAYIDDDFDGSVGERSGMGEGLWIGVDGEVFRAEEYGRDWRLERLVQVDQEFVQGSILRSRKRGVAAPKQVGEIMVPISAEVHRSVVHTSLKQEVSIREQRLLERCGARLGAADVEDETTLYHGPVHPSLLAIRFAFT
jgi:hypothetical protein